MPIEVLDRTTNQLYGHVISLFTPTMHVTLYEGVSWDC
jgi:hypothetical protein